MAYDLRLAGRIKKLLEKQKGVEEKRLFGGVGFLVRGNMACGVHKDELILRLGEADFEAALRKAHTRIFDMTGRPMKGWLLVSKQGYSSDKALQGWVKKSVAFAISLPPK